MYDPDRLELVRSSLAVPRELATPEQVAAWDDLHGQCARVLSRFFRRYEDHWDVIDDLLQDVWVVVLSKLPTRDGPDPALGAPEQWVLGIAKYIAASYGYRRAHAHTEPLSDALVELLLDFASDPCAKCEVSDQRERRHTVIEEFSARLSELNRRIFQMRMRDVPLGAIASATGLSVGAVKLRLHSMYRALRAELKRRGIDPV
jgi:DNA-directed RNA polymerase specialized sigma24 family protein